MYVVTFVVDALVIVVVKRYAVFVVFARRPELGRPIEGAVDYLAVEAAYAASHEGALHLDDVLTRRTHVSIETWDRGVAAAKSVAELLGEVLGWDDATRRREIEHYRARVAAERDSQTQADDRTADAARMGAADVRLGKRAASPDGAAAARPAPEAVSPEA